MSARAWASVVATTFFGLFVVLTAVFWVQTTPAADATPQTWSTVAAIVGGPIVLPVLVLAGAAGLALQGARPAARFLLVAVVGAGTLMYSARLLLQIVGADEDGGRLSDFPSGHVAAVTAVASAAIAIVFSRTRRRRVRAAAVVAGSSAVVFMSIARVDTGAHSPVDVAGGVALGVAWTALCVGVLPPSGVRSPSRVGWLVALLAAGTLGFALLAVTYDHEPLVALDDEVSEWIAAHAPGLVSDLARPFSWLGGWIGITALTIAAIVALARERNWLDLGFVLAAAVGSQLVVALLKALIGRPRPSAGSGVPLPESAAFPSGHATSGIAALGAFTILAAERVENDRARIGIWSAAVVGGLAVGLSRIALNVHYVTDVLAGWCLGLAWLAACLLVRERLRGSG